MKLFILLLFVPIYAFGSCILETKGPGKITGIELYQPEGGCAFPDTQKEECYQIRHLGTGDLGASVFRKSVSVNSYCLGGKEIEVFSPSQKDEPKAFVECSGIGKPTAIRLESKDGKTKKCDFPFLKKSHT